MHWTVRRTGDVNAADNTGTSRLHWAAKENNKDAVVRLLDHGAHVNAVNYFQNTALHWSAFHDCHETALVLLNHGIDVNAVNRGGSTALHTAAMNNSPKTALLLLQHGASVDKVDKDGNSALHLAAMNDSSEIVAILVEHGANMNLANTEERTPLHFVVNYNCKRAAVVLINRGANVGLVGHRGSTILDWAVENNSQELIILLIKCGADINAINKDGNTVLHWAADNSPELAVFLTEHGADINVKSQCGDTVLNIASRKNKRIALHLIDQGADVNAATGNSLTALHWAAVNNNKELALRLLEHGANVDAVDINRNTALHKAAESKGNEVAFLLMEHVADVNAVNADGDTALNLAARSNSVDISRQLLHWDADCNLMNKNGNSVLHWAARNNSKELASLFLHHDADANAMNDEGNTALHWAAKYNSASVAHVLVKYVTSVNATDKSGNTALHYTGKGNNREVAVVLLDHGADTNVVNKAGNTPLHYACMQSAGDATLQELLSCGGNTECRNNMGLTALHYSVTDGDLRAAVLLLRYAAKVNVTDDRGNSPLHLALSKKKFEFASLFLEQPDVFVNKLDEHGSSPFHLLAHVPVTRGDVSQTNTKIADIAKGLLRRGALVNIRNLSDQTPLHLARNVCTAVLLLENDAWPNAKELYNGNTPLISRAKAMHETSVYFYEQSEVQKIVDNGMDPWIANDSGETVLSTWLMQTRNFQAARSLVHVMKGKGNCNINKKHSNGETLLHILCSCERDEALELIELVLESRANVNALNAVSETPLHLVCKAVARVPEEDITSTFSFRIAGQLVAHGANPNLHDNIGNTCRNIAGGKPQLYNLLTCPDTTSITPLLKWLAPKSDNHNSKVAEVVQGRMSFQIETYHYHKEPIGYGSFSHVYAGVDGKDGREVAVKRIEKDRLCRSEDQREISSLVKLCNCEGIVRYYCCLEDSYFVYIILELMEGTLDQYLDAQVGRSCDDNLGIDLCKDILRGLHFFHEMKVLHRDIKPDNILYKTTPRLCLKIADFGLSTTINAKDLRSIIHSCAGTRCWMAPELLEGSQKVTHSFESDVFACGLVLHYILDTKKHPVAPVPENGTERGIIDVQNETERNIMMHKLTISDQLTAEAQHLVGMMLNKEKESRPITGATIGHPLFWSKKKKVRFLNAVGNQPEFQAPRHIVREHSAVEKYLENSVDPTFATNPWDSLIFPTYFEMTSCGGRRYNTYSVIDLVRFMRNAQSHVSDTCRSTQFKQDVLEGFVFLDKFPHLLIAVYKAITSNGWDTDRPEIKSVLFDD